MSLDTIVEIEQMKNLSWHLMTMTKMMTMIDAKDEQLMMIFCEQPMTTMVVPLLQQ